MNRIVYIVVFLGVVLTWLTIQGNVDNEKKRKVKLDYYESLPTEVKTIVDRIKSDSLSYETSIANESIVNDFLIVFKNGDETKLWKDIVTEPDTLSTTDTTRINTIILLQQIETKIGTYQNGADAIRKDYKVSLIKYPEFIVYHQSNLEGSDPPYSIERRSGDKFRGAGQPPDRSKVFDYILSIVQP